MIRVGTSGFSFPEWQGTFYPPGTRDGPAMLAHYAGRLDTVEINYTFRRMPAPSTLARWREKVPDPFRFTLKAHQSITHRYLLRDAGEIMTAFAARAAEMGDMLGAVLFQLPPTMKADVERLASFCESLSVPLAGRAAFEFRHQSWLNDEVFTVLEKTGCALVLAETDDNQPCPVYPAHLVYVRLRREDYSDQQLGDWARRLHEIEESGHDVVCYLKHDLEAPRLALRLKELVEGRAT